MLLFLRLSVNAFLPFYDVFKRWISINFVFSELLLIAFQHFGPKFKHNHYIIYQNIKLEKL